VIPHEAEYVSGYTVLRHHCPLDTCSWLHDQNAMIVNIGTGATVADRELVAHVATHTPLEWANEIARLHRLLERAEDALRRRGIPVDRD
jgi:hypothetical protein